MAARTRVLAFADGNYLSHTTRPLEIARELELLDVEVVFAASGPYTSIIDRQGHARRESFTLPPERIMSFTRRSRMDYYDDALLEAAVASDLEAIAHFAPDLVLGDFRWSLSVSSELAGVPYASLLNILWTHHYALVRSVPEGFLLRRVLGERLVAAIGPPIKRALLGWWGRPFNRVRARHGLAPRQDLNWHLYGDLDLLADVPELFPHHPLPPHVVVVGPIFWSGGVTSSPQRLPPPSSRPLVYASIGSTGTPLFLERLYGAFGGEDVDVVFTTGGQTLERQPPPNFHCLDLVAAGDVLPRAILAVCHGGNGTIYQCLAHGVPVLGIATHNDQQWNLDRVAATGCGWRFTQESAATEDLAACLAAVRSDPGWRLRAVQMAEKIRALPGARNAARALAGYLSRGS